MTDTPTELRAEVNPGFKYKFLLIGVVATLVGLYHFIDPIFVYPKMWPSSEAYVNLAEQLKGNDGELQRQWETMAKAEGWPEVNQSTVPTNCEPTRPTAISLESCSRLSPAFPV